MAALSIISRVGKQLSKEATKQVRSMASWGYFTHETGPDQWGKVASIVDTGKKQSPIDISTLIIDPERKQLKFEYSNDSITTVVNSGKSVTFNAGQEDSYVSKGPLLNRYRLLQFHFHWGSHNDVGSEHTINGKAYSAEIHLVHMNEKYATFADALEHQDGLAVVGAFLQAGGEENSSYKPVIDMLGQVEKTGAVADVKDKIDLEKLLPASRTFTYYEGSLTTPPCSECVQWLNILEPVEISNTQIEAFRGLKCEDGACMVDNYRPCCPLHGREVKLCGY